MTTLDIHEVDTLWHRIDAVVMTGSTRNPVMYRGEVDALAALLDGTTVGLDGECFHPAVKLIGTYAARGSGYYLAYEDLAYPSQPTWPNHGPHGFVRGSEFHPYVRAIYVPSGAYFAWTGWRSRVKSLAIQAFNARHPECDWGGRTATIAGRPKADGTVSVLVTYEPHTGNPAFADRWGKFSYDTVQVVDASVGVAA